MSNLIGTKIKVKDFHNALKLIGSTMSSVSLPVVWAAAWFTGGVATGGLLVGMWMRAQQRAVFQKGIMTGAAAGVMAGVALGGKNGKAADIADLFRTFAQ